MARSGCPLESRRSTALRCGTVPGAASRPGTPGGSRIKDVRQGALAACGAHTSRGARQPSRTKRACWKSIPSPGCPGAHPSAPADRRHKDRGVCGASSRRRRNVAILAFDAAARRAVAVRNPAALGASCLTAPKNERAARTRWGPSSTALSHRQAVAATGAWGWAAERKAERGRDRRSPRDQPKSTRLDRE